MTQYVPAKTGFNSAADGKYRHNKQNILKQKEEQPVTLSSPFLQLIKISTVNLAGILHAEVWLYNL